jgi:phosphoglycerate dehydrogenase-like enzyme
MKLLLMYRPDAEHWERLRSAAPNARLAVAESEQHAIEEASDADAILGNRYCMQALPHAPKVRWVQSNSVGMDILLRSAHLQRDTITLCNARGVYDDELADHTLALLLGIARGLPAIVHQQHRQEWTRVERPALRGKHVLVLGGGRIGSAVATRLNAFGARCSAACLSPRAQSAPFERIWTGEQWRAELGRTDFLVVALPLTERTRNVLGDPELSLLRDGTVLVNVARGELLDEGALQRHLPRLGGAALDVFREEPLPPGHWMWSHQQVLVSPHLGRSPERSSFRFQSLFEENVRRFAAGEPLLNVVNKREGY